MLIPNCWGKRAAARMVFGLALAMLVSSVPQRASAQGYYAGGSDDSGGGGGKGGSGGGTQPGDDKGGQTGGNGGTQPGDDKGGQTGGNGGTQPGDDKGGQTGGNGGGTQPGDDKGGQTGGNGGGTQPGDDKGGSSTPGAEVHLSGNIERLPATGILGDWMVAGITVHVLASTAVQQNGGPAATGACVAVEGSRNSDQTVTAREIKVQSAAGGCAAGAAHDLRNEVEFSGFVQGIPQTGMLFGLWQIAGRSVQVTAATEIRLGKAPLAAGGCAEVRGSLSDDGSVSAARLSLTDEPRACGGGAQPEIVGIVESMPASGALGDWTIGGHLVHVDVSSVVDDSSAVAAGACVEARGVLQSDNSLTATRVERVEDVRCGSSNTPIPAVIEVEGLIEAVPANRAAGAFTIAGKTVQVNGATAIDDSRGSVAVGTCAEVSGTLQPDGTIAASRLEVESASGTCLFRSGVTSAASFSTGSVSPGQLVSIFGMNLGPDDRRSMQVSSDDTIATQLGNVHVYFNGVPAALLMTSRTQVNALVPFEVRGKETAEVQVENNGAWSNPVSIRVTPAAPAIFTASENGRGQARALNYEAEHGSYVLNDDAHPAGRGSTIVLYATGLGETEDARHDGRIARSASSATLPVKVSIGGRDAQVYYAGSAPGLVSGVMQVNARVPDDTPAGLRTPVVITAGEQRSRDDVTVAVR